MSFRSFLLLLVLLPLSLAKAGSPEDAAAWLKKTIAPCFSEDADRGVAAREKIEATGVTPKLKKLFARDKAETPTGEVGRLDFDWVVNGQDVSSDWTVAAPFRDGKSVVVPVVTRWSDGEYTHFFLLDPAGKGWVIANVWYPRGRTLLQILD